MVKNNWMKCVCGKIAYYTKDLTFNGYVVDGWKCKHCNEAYLNPIEAERILILNKLKKQRFNLKLNRVKSNLILRLPKQVGEVLKLKNGDELKLTLNKKDQIILFK